MIFQYQSLLTWIAIEEENEREVIQMDEFKCLHCGAIIEADDCIDLSNEGDYILAKMTGHCPECETEYTWKEEYTYSESFSLEEC